ncbi:hypothetical protein FRB94_010328 [Tulasnella sp. JGI-2019a]|nr:hypothetical protein FRB94_010328 [Tulasnella sp. JGI-2019a]KAG8997488.1 hypothetical protein FRB93_014099 [Tulasnella sp. JGI-2019a]KAG9026549.1 hypothetical protein FRB95_008720 [Tulasnella sp. JGI-2019a]
MSAVPTGGTSTDFSFGERLGLVFIVMASCLSITSILVLLAYVVVLAIRRRRSSSHHRHLLRHGADYYVLSLFAFDVIQATGRVMHIAWIRQARVNSGAYCTAQGAIQHVGSMGTALMTLAIGVTSFAVIVLRWPNSASKTIPIIVHAFTITLLILFTVVPTSLQSHFYASVGFWCWISPAHHPEQIALEYGWFWLTGLINFILYVLIFLALRGNLLVTFDSEATDGWGRGSMHAHWERNRNRRASIGTSEERKRLMRTARRLLAYPIVYIITILPMTIIRWIQFIQPHHNIPSEAIAFSSIVYTSSGFFNAILYTITHWRFLTRSTEPQITTAIEVTMKSESHHGSGLPSFGPGNLDDTFSGITDDQIKTQGSDSAIEGPSVV